MTPPAPALQGEGSGELGTLNSHILRVNGRVQRTPFAKFWIGLAMMLVLPGAVLLPPFERLLKMETAGSWVVMITIWVVVIAAVVLGVIIYRRGVRGLDKFQLQPFEDLGLFSVAALPKDQAAALLKSMGRWTKAGGPEAIRVALGQHIDEQTEIPAGGPDIPPGLPRFRLASVILVALFALWVVWMIFSTATGDWQPLGLPDVTAFAFSIFLGWGAIHMLGVAEGRSASASWAKWYAARHHSA